MICFVILHRFYITLETKIICSIDNKSNIVKMPTFNIIEYNMLNDCFISREYFVCNDILKNME